MEFFNCPVLKLEMLLNFESEAKAIAFDNKDLDDDIWEIN